VGDMRRLRRLLAGSVLRVRTCGEQMTGGRPPTLPNRSLAGRGLRRAGGDLGLPQRRTEHP
jgi:hypothetical protein